MGGSPARAPPAHADPAMSDPEIPAPEDPSRADAAHPGQSEDPRPRDAEGRPVGPPAVSGVSPADRRAIVVGASSGIGRALVKRLAAQGFHVAALARREELLTELAQECAADAAASGGAVLTRVHDVHDTAAVPGLFEELARAMGGIDLLIYAAGIMPSIERDEYDTVVDLDILAVNFAGCVAWGNAVAPFFATQRSGVLVGISSIAGDRGRKGNPMYGASKAAMDHYLEALRNRLSENAVHVCTIKPGYIDTAMTQGMQGLFWVITPDEAARQILGAARNRVNTRYVPMRWQAVGTTLKLIPSFVFRKLNF